MDFYRQPQSKSVLVSGLKWQALDPFDSTHNQIARFITDGNRWCVKFKNGTDVNYGLGTDFNAETYAGCTITSIGALVAINPNFQGGTALLLLENTVAPDQGAIAIGILSGNVVLDRQFDLQHTDSIIEEFAKLCGKASRAFLLWGDVPVSQREYDHQYSLVELSNPKNKGFKASKLIPLKTERTVLFVIAGVGIAILLGASSMGWEMHKEKQKEAVDAINRLNNSPASQYKRSADKFFSKDLYLTSISTKAIQDQINSFPIRFQGWQLAEMQCTLPKCRVKWRSKGGTFGDFKNNAPPAWTNIRITDSGEGGGLGDLKTIMSDLTLDLPTSHIPPKDSWPNITDFMWTTGEWWQKLTPLNWKAAVKSAEIQEIPPGVQRQAIATQKSLLWGVPWSTQNQPWWMLVAIQKSLGDTATYTKLTITYDEKLPAIVFNAEGIVYVQKK